MLAIVAYFTLLTTIGYAATKIEEASKEGVPKAPRPPSAYVLLPAPITPIQRQGGVDTGCGFVPAAAYLDAKLSAEVEQFAENGHRGKLAYAERLVKMVLERVFPGIRVWTTGSLPAGVDLAKSDIDMTVKMPDGAEGTAVQKLFRMKGALGGCKALFSKVYVVRARVPVLQLKLADSGVEVDVTIDNEDGKRNTQLLVWYGQVDARFPLLCRAVKSWASSVGVEGAAKGRLNSFTLCMMVISYLQTGVSPAVLPNLQEALHDAHGPIDVADDEYAKRNVRQELEAAGHRFGLNRSSVGCLFAGFLKYYAQFDFRSKWISIRRGAVLPKRVDEEGRPLDGMPDNHRYICVEDPFIESAWNCGGSVWAMDTFERLRGEFGASFERLLASRSIFGGLPSEARRKMDADGRRRDLSLIEWTDEVLEKWHAEELEKAKTWSPDDQQPKWITPFKGSQHPKVYWCEEKNQKVLLEPWPEVIRCYL